MRLGFDLDGIIIKNNLAILRLIDLIEDPEKRREVSKYYYKQQDILLDPLKFLLEEDELYIITSRNRIYREETEALVKKYFPSAKLIILDHVEPHLLLDLKDWYKKQAELKAKVIKKEGIEVYFEDIPQVVRYLRNLCPNTKIICFGDHIE